MFDAAKYVVFEDEFGCEQMIIFGCLMEHAKTANRMRALNIISAGFISIGTEPLCYGKSESLGISSRDELDSRLAKRILNMEQ